MAQFDLLPRMTSFLDPQLVFALLEFARSKNLYKEEDVLAAQLALLKHTNMVEFMMELYQILHKTNEPSQALKDRKEEVVQRMEDLGTKAKPILEIISVDENVARLPGERAGNSAFLKDTYGMGPDHVDALFNYAKMVYECGDYFAARELLHQYNTYSMDAAKLLSALWGKLACEILIVDYDNAHDTMGRLREAIDTHLFADALKQLQERAWLLHWSLFVFFNTPDGPSQLLDLFLQDRFLVALQIHAPHLLRYLVAAHLVMKKPKESGSNKWYSQLSNIKRIIISEEHHYSDPITDFVKCVHVDYDFDRAQEQLKLCAEILENDYFLMMKKDAFMEQARMAIFEVYCRIHQCIHLDALAKQVGKDREQAEVWIAQLIRNAQLDARIDSTSGTVVMGTQYVDPLDTIVDRTSNLAVRTFKVANTIIDATQRSASSATAA